MIAIMSFSGIAMKGMFISRTFNELTPNHVSNSILHIDYSGTYFEPCYNPTIFKEEVNAYFKKTLKGEIDKYKIGFVYYKYDKTNKKYVYCSGSYTERIKKIDLYFECQYNKIFTFKGKGSFEVTEKDLWLIKLLNILKIVF